MSILLDGIEEQKEARNIVHDADGEIYLSCYRHRESGNIEMMYVDFWMRINSIEAEVWKTYKIENSIISLTSKKNFRHSLTEKWKADRKAKPLSEMTEKQLSSYKESKKLRGYVSEVKKLLYERMS